MHGPLVLRYSAAALATSCAAVALPAASSFYLVTKSTEGGKLDGLYLGGFHTGAGESAVVAGANKSDGIEFSLMDSRIGFSGGSPPEPYTIGLPADGPPYNSTAPGSYSVVTLNVGRNAKGFSIDRRSGGLIVYAGAVDLATFAVCRVNGIAPYQSLGAQDQLLWRNATSPAHAHCPTCSSMPSQSNVTRRLDRLFHRE